MSGKKKKKKDAHQSKETPVPDEKEIDSESLLLYENAKSKLEAKSKIYNKMQNGEMEDFENIYGETKYLVDFQQNFFDSDKNEENAAESDSEKSTFPSSIYEADEVYREKLREKWEKEQEEILEGAVHYEHVKFDEVRNLGTGYFAFSKNEEERQKQMEELRKLREDTKNVQAKKELLKKKRKAALQERLNKVKQRKLGKDVSPMDRLNALSSETSENTEEVNKSDIFQKSSEISQMSAIEKITHEEEYEKEKLTNFSSSVVNDVISDCRKATHKQREWDIGKTNKNIHQSFVPQKKKKTTLEQIIKERRDERPDEFRPPSFY